MSLTFLFLCGRYTKDRNRGDGGIEEQVHHRTPHKMLITFKACLPTCLLFSMYFNICDDDFRLLYALIPKRLEGFC